MALVSVIVVNHNGRQDLVELLDSLTRQVRAADEVILVDNASRDDSVAFVRREFPWVRVVPLAKNVGFPEANNQGLAATSGDYIALINPDATAEERWLAELLDVVERDDRIAAVSPKIYRTGSPAILEQAGAEFNNLGHYWTRGFNQPERGQFDVAGEVPGLTGCSVLVRRSALHGEPLFDGNFFLYYEEFDLTLRLRGRGYAIAYAPRAIVYHKGMQTVANLARHPNLLQQFYCNRNRLKILAKFYPLTMLFRNLPLIALSLLYWDAIFFWRSGPAYCLRAMVAQARFALQGLCERRQVTDVDPGLWLPWMTRQGLRDIRALRVARGGER